LYTIIITSKGSFLLGQEDTTWLWHEILGHINFENLEKIITKVAIRDMPRISNPSNNICSSCQKGKQTRTSLKTKEYHYRKPLELVNTNLCGTTKNQSIHGHK